MEERAKILEKIKILVEKDVEIDEVWNDIQQHKAEFEKSVEIFQKTELEIFVDDGGEEGGFVPEKVAEQSDFNDLINLAKEKKAKKEADIQAEYENNLKEKKAVIAELVAVIQSEENIGKAFNKMNELREKWQTLGNVSSHEYKALQNEYSNALEQFFYNINIYKELQAHDLKKNLQLREEILANIKALEKEKSIATVRTQINAFLSDWDNIGPVEREDWDKLREEFRTLTKQTFDRIKTHFSEIKEKRTKSSEAKAELIAKAKAIVEQERENLKDWKKHTDAIIELQGEWKKLGFGLKKDNELLWEEFRSVCNSFFDAKSEIYGKEKEKWGKNKARKEDLIKKAEGFKESTDWKESTIALVNLQKQWKKVGPASQKDEQCLWKQFRAVCDTFFNAKKEYYDTLDDRLAENLTKKKEFISKVEKTKLEGSVDENKAAIKELSAEWDALGQVPRDSFKEINDSYRKAIESLYGQLGLTAQQADNLQYEDKVLGFAKSKDASRLLDNEKRFFAEQIDKLKKEILQYENNLAFLGFSKGATADKMRADVQSKIDAIQKQIDKVQLKERILKKAIRSVEA